MPGNNILQRRENATKDCQRIWFESTSRKGRYSRPEYRLDSILGDVFLCQKQKSGFGNSERLHEVLTIEPRAFENTRDFAIDTLASYSLEHPVPCNAKAYIFRRLLFCLQDSVPELIMTIGLVQY